MRFLCVASAAHFLFYKESIMNEKDSEELLEEKIKQLNELAERLFDEGKSLNTPELMQLDVEIYKLRMQEGSDE